VVLILPVGSSITSNDLRQTSHDPSVLRRQAPSMGVQTSLAYRTFARRSRHAIVADRSTPILPSLTQSDRTRKRRSMIVGTLEDSPSESQAQAEVDKLRLNINSFTSSLPSKDISVDQLVNHYREFELPDIFSRMSRKESRMMSQENPEPS
jgi:hypothetical protein